MKQNRKSVLLALGWYVQEIDRGVARYAREHDWILEDISCHAGRIPPAWKGDGIITLFSDRTQSDLLSFIRKTKLPVVGVSDQIPEIKIPRVLPDNHAIGRLAAEEFVSRGFKHFAYLCLDNQAPVVMERCEGFRTGTAAAAVDFTILDYTGFWDKKNAADGLIHWLGRKLKKLPKPLAVMAQYDAEANYVVRACLDAELAIPGEVAVIGVDNDPIYSELGPIPLTSVLSNREKIGYKGAAMLDQLMQGKKVQSPLRVPPSGLVLRRSSDIFASEDPALTMVLTYIAEHLTEPDISVDKLVKIAGVSRRGLYLKFARYVGHSVQREVMRQRLNRARHLLLTTDWKVSTIAEACGFADGISLTKAFRLHEDTTCKNIRTEEKFT